MRDFQDYFSVQAFLIVFRETLELAIIISVLLAFVNQSFKSTEKSDGYQSISQDETLADEVEPTLSRVTDSETSNVSEDDAALSTYLRLQIWFGGILGLLVCLVIGTVILTVFYTLGEDFWTINEHYWEGTFSILASIIISVMGVKVLRINKMKIKWKQKLTAILHQKNSIEILKNGGLSGLSEKYALFILPFITTLREGMEAVVFMGGIGINENTPVISIINSTVTALALGAMIGVSLYKYGNSLSLQFFLIFSTCLLYLIAAGLFSKGFWNFELQKFIEKCGGLDVTETGHGPGSYDINHSVWHVNCCNGELQEDGAFWMLFTAILGWTNSATYISVISYNVYWIIVIIVFGNLIYEEKYGYLPMIPLTWQRKRIIKRMKLQNGSVAESRDSVDSRTMLVR
jgi:high-affinity iron transporter